MSQETPEIERGSMWTRPEVRGRWKVEKAGPKRITLRSTLPFGRARTVPRQVFFNLYERVPNE